MARHHSTHLTLLGGVQLLLLLLQLFHLASAAANKRIPCSPTTAAADCQAGCRAMTQDNVVFATYPLPCCAKYPDGVYGCTCCRNHCESTCSLSVIPPSASSSTGGNSNAKLTVQCRELLQYGNIIKFEGNCNPPPESPSISSS